MKPDWMEALEKWDAEGVACAEAILASRQQSSPRMPGARLVVNERGELAGGVSMGCVENDLRAHLAGILKGEGEARMVRYGAAFDPLLEVGLSCGGEIGVWLRKHDAGSAAWKESLELEGKEAYLLWTRLDGESLQGVWKPGEAAPGEGLEEVFGELWRKGETRKVKDAAGEAWFAEARRPEPLLAVVGASPIAVELCAMAGRCGWRVALVDPRSDYAREGLFPGARVIHEWPEEGLAAAGVDGEAYVAILAHDAKLDVPALRAALAAGAKYVGLLGSAKTRDDRYEKLGAGADVSRVHSPIGLKGLGGIEPAEIAVSILAEMIAVRRGAK